MGIRKRRNFYNFSHNFDIFPTRDPELGRPDPLKPSAVSGDINIIVNLKWPWLLISFIYHKIMILWRRESWGHFIFDNFLNIQCPGTKPTLPAEERNAVSTSQKPSSGSHHPSLYLRLSQVVKSSHCFWDLLHEKCLKRNAPCLITPSPTQGHCQKHLKGSKLQKLAKTVTSPWSWNYQKFHLQFSREERYLCARLVWRYISWSWK